MQSQERTTSDSELMSSIVQQDEDALTELYHRYGNLVYGLAMRIMQNRELADEITQDTFLTVWNHSDTWIPARGRLSTWLLSVTRHKAIDRIRREQCRPDGHACLLEEAQLESSPASQPDDSLLDDRRLIRALLAQLPPDQAQVIELAFFQGMTHSAMADFLHLPLGTVKTRVRLGLQKLKACWESANNSGGDYSR